MAEGAGGEAEAGARGGNKLKKKKVKERVNNSTRKVTSVERQFFFFSFPRNFCSLYKMRRTLPPPRPQPWTFVTCHQRVGVTTGGDRGRAVATRLLLGGGELCTGGAGARLRCPGAGVAPRGMGRGTGRGTDGSCAGEGLGGKG